MWNWNSNPSHNWNMWCVARFGTICTVKKSEKHPWRSVNFRACNFTKINTPPWVFFTCFKLYKCCQIAQRTTIALELFFDVHWGSFKSCWNALDVQKNILSTITHIYFFWLIKIFWANFLGAETGILVFKMLWLRLWIK